MLVIPPPQRLGDRDIRSFHRAMTMPRAHDVPASLTLPPVGPLPGLGLQLRRSQYNLFCSHPR